LIPSGAYPSLPQFTQPRLFFLFMAHDRLPNLELWDRFFKNAVRGLDYETFVHCSDLKGCLRNQPNLLQFYQPVKTVDSQWCIDLVSPMNALLSEALVGKTKGPRAGSPLDKFIFVSHNTVPIKSFSYVQNKLIMKDWQKSNFCIEPWDGWAWYKGKYVLAKHSQWLTLSRAHAEKALDLKVTPQHLFRQMAPVTTWGRWDWSAKLLWKVRQKTVALTHSPILDSILSLLMPAVRGCADEWWHLAAVVGAFDPKQAAHTGVDIKSVQNGMLTMKDEIRHQHQGVCDTYAVITEFDRDDGISQILQDEEDTSTMHGTGSFLRPHIHAGTFSSMSAKFLNALHKSAYLFARKIDNSTKYDGNMTLVDAFDMLIFN